MTSPAPQRRHCAQPDDCKAIGAGHCRSCSARAMQSDPAHRAKQEAGLRRWHATPEAHALRCATMQRVVAAQKDDPAWIEKQRRSGVRLRAAYDASPDAQARNLAQREAVGRKLRAQRLAWCPPEYRDDYQRIRKKGTPADKARALIEELIERDRKRYLATGKLQQAARA